MIDFARRTLSVLRRLRDYLRLGWWLNLAAVLEAGEERRNDHAQRLENRLRRVEEQQARNTEAIYALLQRVARLEGDPPEAT